MSAKSFAKKAFGARVVRFPLLSAALPARVAPCIGVFVLVAVSLVAAQDVPQLTVGHLTDGEGPVIDGNVTEAEWALAQPFSAFVQQEPNEGEPGTERTEVRFLIDRQNLYIAVICYDSTPGEIVVSESRRDASLADTDSIEILLDTFNDGQNGFVFGTNPFGIELDGQVMGEGQTAAGGFIASGVGGSQRGQVRGFNANWDADWTVRALTTERGWEAEFAIPLKTLRYNPGTERTWGLNVMRNIRRKNEQVFLSPVPRGYSLYRVSASGKLNGLEPADEAGSQVHSVRVWLGQRRQDAPHGPRRSHGPRSASTRSGASAADLTLDATVNTDFAQVEADEEQVNLTRFALVLPGEAAVLPRERPALSSGPAPGGRSVLFTPDRPRPDRAADRHHRGRTAQRQAGRRLQRRAAEPADR